MAARSRDEVLRVNMDPALGDLALAEARDALAQGDWEPARELLADGRHLARWDRRSHRVRVLAEAVANSAWVERWQVLEPLNPDAALLRAQVETVRALRARIRGTDHRPLAEEALSLVRHAADMAPADPTPWSVLLTLSRTDDRTPQDRAEFWRRWQGLRARDAFHRDGQHEALTYLFQVWHGSHREMYDFAYWLAGEAPPGSPLAVLPLVAHAEVFRTQAAQPAAASPAEHWGRPRVRADIEQVLHSWLGSGTVTHAQADLDRNHLLHALVLAGRADSDVARALFEAIGTHATRVPWGYTGDPESSFLYWRDRAFGGTPSRSGR